MTICKHIPGWLSKEEAAEVYMAALNMGLEQRSIRLKNNLEIIMPRLTAWCCDTGEGYGYSGQYTPAVNWPEKLLVVRRRLELELQRAFPSCLINMYRDEKDSVGWHRDDEGLFGPNLVIATVSLGGTRKFQLKQDKNKAEYELADGDLLIMPEKVNKEWAHCVPKSTVPALPRISLTYRTMEK